MYEDCVVPVPMRLFVLLVRHASGVYFAPEDLAAAVEEGGELALRAAMVCARLREKSAPSITAGLSSRFPDITDGLEAGRVLARPSVVCGGATEPSSPHLGASSPHLGASSPHLGASSLHLEVAGARSGD